MSKPLFTLTAVIAVSFSLSAQRTAPTPPGGGGAGNIPTNPNPTVPGGSRTSPTQPFPTDRTNPMPDFTTRPIFLSGKVMLDDGTPPPEPVAIQRVCGGMHHTEAYTNSKGQFSFELGKNLGVLPDASEENMGGVTGGSRMGSNMPGMAPVMGGRNAGSEQMLMGCELQAYLPGFRSDAVNLSTRRALENPEVGTIILHRLGNVQGLTISATSALAPKDAKKAFEKANNSIKKQKWDDAQRELEKAVEVYPKYAAAWYKLGLIEQKQGNVESARKSYAQALAADSKYVNPYQELALLAVREGKWQDVKDNTDRLLSLDGIDFPIAWYYNAVANYYLHNNEAAEKSAREALKIDKEHHIPKINQLMGVLLAEKQDYAGAAQSLKEFLKLAPSGPEAETVKKQIVQLEHQSQASTSEPKTEPQP